MTEGGSPPTGAVTGPTAPGPAFTVLVPARLASTRLPGKPLADIVGLPMIVRVAQAAARSRARRVVVAADHAGIVDACREHGVDAILTRDDHATGSDRLAEACVLLGLGGDAMVVNVQGDEPLIEPSLIDACAALLDEAADCVMATAAHPLGRASPAANPAWSDPNVVKVVLDARRRALYFSRAPIPWQRDRDAALDPLAASHTLRHVGLYAYRAGYLRRFPQLAPAPLERIEALEQLRVLWHGGRIVVHVAADAPEAGVDTPEDLERVRRKFALSTTR